MDVSVIIPTRDRAEKLRLTLRTLEHQVFDGLWEVVVVNNSSTDQTDEVVAEIAAEFLVPLRLVHETRPGAAAARNHGARVARAGVLLFLDDDMLAPGDLVARHLETVTSNPGTWVLGQAKYPDGIRSTPFGRFRDSLHTLYDENAGLVDVDSFASGNCSMPADDLRLVGGYNEEFTTAALEDADLYVRARRNGRRVVVDPRILAVHNDWAADSLEHFCRRQRIYGRSAPILQARFGNDHPRAEWVRKNSPPSRADPISMIANKAARAAMGTHTAQRAVYRAAGLLERWMPDSRPLRAAYRAAIVGSMYRGMSEGRRAASSERRRPVPRADRPTGRTRSPSVAVLEALDVPARLLAGVGLHRVNSAGRRIVERVTADRLSVTADGVRLTGQVAHRGYLYGIRRGQCEPYMASLFATVVESGMVVVDVGAFIGYYTVKAGLAVGPTGAVFSLEPDSANFRALEANVEANGTGEWTVLLRSAAGDQEGEVPFFVDRWDPSQSGLGGFRPGARRADVPIQRLDKILAEVDHVDVVKIDVEGFEMAVLSGMNATVSRMNGGAMTVFVECFPEALRSLGSSPEAVLEWLRNYDFSVGLIDERTRSITPLETNHLAYGNWFCTTDEARWRALVTG